MVLTKQEQAMERKFAELRKKKEERKRKEEEAAAAAAAATTAPKPVPGEGLSAMEKAKAALARRAAAGQAKKPEAVKRSTPKPASQPSGTPDAPVDPVQAAKRALEARNRKQEGSALMRPTIKRLAKPMPAGPPKGDQSTASPSHPSPHHSSHQSNKRAHEDEWGHSNGHRHEAKRPRYGNDGNQQEEESDTTLFVGDLPPYFKNEDLEHMFSPYGELRRMRVMGSQCYAFVTFERPEIVQQIVEKYRNKPLTVAGHPLRINGAHGQLPDWKRGIVPGEEGAPQPVRGLHPKVLAAQAEGDALAQRLLAAGAHGLDLLTARPPPQRELISYDDL